MSKKYVPSPDFCIQVPNDPDTVIWILRCVALESRNDVELDELLVELGRAALLDGARLLPVARQPDSVYARLRHQTAVHAILRLCFDRRHNDGTSLQENGR